MYGIYTTHMHTHTHTHTHKCTVFYNIYANNNCNYYVLLSSLVRLLLLLLSAGGVNAVGHASDVDSIKS